jgi:hypothetical protein
MIKLKDLISEDVISLHPDWNRIQIKVFKSLQQSGYDYDYLLNNMNHIGELLRDYMNNKYPSAGWEVGASDSEDVEAELISHLKKNLDPVTQ